MIFILPLLSLSLILVIPIQAMEQDKQNEPNFKSIVNTIASIIHNPTSAVAHAYTNPRQYQTGMQEVQQNLDYMYSTEIIEAYTQNKLIVQPDNLICFQESNTCRTLPIEAIHQKFLASITINQSYIHTTLKNINSDNLTPYEIYIAMSGFLQWIIKEDIQAPNIASVTRIAVKNALLKPDINELKAITMAPQMANDAFEALRFHFFTHTGK